MSERASSRSRAQIEGRAVACLAPLALWVALTLGPVFYAHGGHRQAFVFGENQLCHAEDYTPRATSKPWGDEPGHPLVLLHLSDLHVNDIDGGVAKKHVSMFLEQHFATLANVVDATVITGDLVSSKKYPAVLRGLLGHHSVQFQSEWDWYNATAERAVQSMRNKVWLTVPGNHDSFGSPTKRLYQTYGVHARTSREWSGRRVYSHTIRNHTLIGLDATLPLAPHRPLNFFGMITPESAQELQHAVKQSLQNGRSCVVFSHYPSSVLAGGAFLRKALSTVDPHLASYKSVPRVLLSGHLHSLRGIAPSGLQSVSHTGHLDLQLTDMFTTGAFRVFVIDHGLPSWRDFTVHEPLALPVVIVLNLPRVGLCTPGAGLAALRSTHIRLLVLAAGPEGVDDLDSTGIRVSIDGRLVGVAHRAGQADGGHSAVFIVPWNATEYGAAPGTSVLRAQAVGSSQTLVEHKFSITGSAPSDKATESALFIGAFFGLSDFATIARLSVWTGLSAALALSVLRCVLFPRYSLIGLAQAAVLLAMMVGPIVISRDLTEAGGWGFVSLGSMSVAEGTLAGIVDPFFAMFTVVFFGALPGTYASTIRVLHKPLRHSWLVTVLSAAAMLRPFTWTFSVAGAHGIVAALISPSCAPLVAVLLSGLPIFGQRIAKYKLKFC